MKPANILLNSNGGIKLCDFGLETGDDLGTIAYMSVSEEKNFVFFKTFIVWSEVFFWQAERLRAEIDYGSLDEGERADIWSLGVTVLQLAIGDYPFPRFPTEAEFDEWFSFDSYGIKPRYPGISLIKGTDINEPFKRYIFN